MNSKFGNRLKVFLDSECDDYDLSYSWETVEDTDQVNVTIKRLDGETDIYFKYDESKDELMIDMTGEDSFEVVREFDSSVKYFWMLVSADLFSR